MIAFGPFSCLTATGTILAGPQTMHARARSTVVAVRLWFTDSIVSPTRIPALRRINRRDRADDHAVSRSCLHTRIAGENARANPDLAVSDDLPGDVGDQIARDAKDDPGDARRPNSGSVAGERRYPITRHVMSAQRAT